MDEKQENVNIENEQQNDTAASSGSEANFNINKEDLKTEAANTVNQVKDTIKNTDFKNDSKAAKGFFSSFFKNPIEELKKVSTESGNKFLKIAIIVLVIWLVAILASNIFSIASRYLFGTYGSFSYFFKNLFSNVLALVKDLVAPIITVLVLSGLVYGFKKNKNKSFLTIASSILISQIPTVIASVISLLTIIGSGIVKITSAFSGFCGVLSTVLLFFAIKDLSDEDRNDSYFWKFALIMGIYYIVRFVVSYLGIYL